MVDPVQLPPDSSAEPDGFLVEVEPAVRLHFLDWGAPQPAADGDNGVGDDGRASIVLVHGLGQTAWSWTPVARRLCRRRRVVAMDVRGHGLSDSPPEGYDLDRLAEDVLAVVDGAAMIDGAGIVDATDASDRQVVLGGHGFGASIAAVAAARLGWRCGGLLLVDGGLENRARDAGMTLDEFEREVSEPPEVMRSMATFLADRAAFDPGTWDADQERAARSTVVEVPAGHLVPAVRPHAFHALLATMLAHDPQAALDALDATDAPVVAFLAGDAEVDVRASRATVGRMPGAGHNLMRYRPDEVARELFDMSA